jgi:hypothetical protein
MTIRATTLASDNQGSHVTWWCDAGDKTSELSPGGVPL